MRLASFVRPLCAAALCVAAGAVHAADFSFAGNATYNTDVVEVSFTLAADATGVQLWTDSFAGGLNYDPSLAVWRKAGSDYTLFALGTDDASFAPNQTAFDDGLRLDLQAGSYLVTLAAWPGDPAGTLLSAGFDLHGEAKTLIAAWNQPDYDINANDQKGTFWRVNLSGVDAAAQISPVPEPSAYALMSLGLGLMAVAARRRG